MKNLLIPVDLSEISHAVVEGASCFGQSLACNLWLLHVVPFSQDAPFNLDRNLWRKEIAKGLRDRRRQLYEIAEQLRRQRYHVFTRIIAGTVSTVILEEAARIKADLIVIGSHGHGHVYHALFGGVGQKVARKASCPVMLVSGEIRKSEWHLLQQEQVKNGERYKH